MFWVVEHSHGCCAFNRVVVLVADPRHPLQLVKLVAELHQPLLALYLPKLHSKLVAGPDVAIGKGEQGLVHCIPNGHCYQQANNPNKCSVLLHGDSSIICAIQVSLVPERFRNAEDSPHPRRLNLATAPPQFLQAGLRRGKGSPEFHSAAPSGSLHRLLLRPSLLRQQVAATVVNRAASRW